MPNVGEMIAVLETVRRYLSDPTADFTWSSWADRDAALNEIDGILSGLKRGDAPRFGTLGALFAPTGPIQEVRLSSGWGETFLDLADRMDAAISNEGGFNPVERSLASETTCGCLESPSPRLLEVEDLGMDGHFAEVTILTCRECGRLWLRYFYESEAYTGSGRWFLGLMGTERPDTFTAGRAKPFLEGLDGYYYGGSYFGGRMGRSSGKIYLLPNRN